MVWAHVNESEELVAEYTQDVKLKTAEVNK